MSTEAESQNLLEKQQINPSEYAFGAAVAYSCNAQGNFRGSKTLSAEILSRARQLQDHIIRLNQSTNPVDTQARNVVNHKFRESDHAVASDDLAQEGTFMEFSDDFEILRWLEQVSYTDVAKFALWNVQRRNALQRRLDEDQPLLQADVMTNIAYLIGEDIFPQKATQLFQQSIDQYGRFHAMDTFEVGFMSASGYANTSRIAISNLFVRNDMVGHSRALKDNVLHEYIHGVGFRGGRGFMDGVWTPIPIRWLEEHTVSHFTAVASADHTPGHDMGRPNIFYPTMRLEFDRPYIDESNFYGALDREIEEKLPADLLGHAYIEPPDTTRGEMLRKDLEARLIKATGSEKSYFDLANAYETAQLRSTRQGLFIKELCRIKGIEPPLPIEEAVEVVEEVVSYIGTKES